MHVLAAVAVGTGTMEKILLAGLGFVVGVQVNLLFELLSTVGETTLWEKKIGIFSEGEIGKTKKLGKFEKIGSNYRKNNQKRKKILIFFNYLKKGCFI